MDDDSELPPFEGGIAASASGVGSGSSNIDGGNGKDLVPGVQEEQKQEQEQEQEQDRKSKKKTRLQWDEENLTLNALEMERTPKMKIDEPKTPYANGPASEAGSSTSGSAPGSPAPYFIPKERLKGFQALEEAAAASAADGTVLRVTRGVQIVNDPAGGGSGDGPSEEFEAKRRKHYAGEAAPARTPRAVQIVDAREEAADGTAVAENAQFAARRQQHYANEARLMRAEWSDVRVRRELQPEAPHLNANAEEGSDSDQEAGLPNGHGNGNGAANGMY